MKKFVFIFFFIRFKFFITLKFTSSYMPLWSISEVSWSLLRSPETPFRSLRRLLRRPCNPIEHPGTPGKRPLDLLTLTRIFYKQMYSWLKKTHCYEIWNVQCLASILSDDAIKSSIFFYPRKVCNPFTTPLSWSCASVPLTDQQSGYRRCWRWNCWSIINPECSKSPMITHPPPPPSVVISQLLSSTPSLSSFPIAIAAAATVIF